MTSLRLDRGWISNEQFFFRRPRPNDLSGFSNGEKRYLRETFARLFEYPIFQKLLQKKNFDYFLARGGLKLKERFLEQETRLESDFKRCA
jgi:hypothetical protein